MLSRGRSLILLTGNFQVTRESWKCHAHLDQMQSRREKRGDRKNKAERDNGIHI